MTCLEYVFILQGELNSDHSQDVEVYYREFMNLVIYFVLIITLSTRRMKDDCVHINFAL